MNELQELGYIDYSLDRKNKHLTYHIKDWVMQCCGAECDDGTVYATECYGFICVPRNITDRLGSRWGWERTKVWRFFQNNACTFGLHRMPGSFGSLIFNLAYFEDDRVTMPSDGKILYLLGKIREASRKGIKAD